MRTPAKLRPTDEELTPCEIAARWASESDIENYNTQCFLVESALAGKFELLAPRDLAETFPEKFIRANGNYYAYALRSLAGEVIDKTYIARLFGVAYLNLRRACEASGLSYEALLGYHSDEIMNLCLLQYTPSSDEDFLILDHGVDFVVAGRIRNAISLVIAKQFKIERDGFHGWLVLWDADFNEKEFPSVEQHRKVQTPRFWLKKVETAADSDWGRAIPGYKSLMSGLPLAEARKRLSPSALWGLIEFEEVAGKGPERHRQLISIANKYLIDNLVAGSLLAKGHLKDSKERIRDRYIPKSHWRFLVVDYDQSSARSELISYHGVLVFGADSGHRARRSLAGALDFVADKGLIVLRFVRSVVTIARDFRPW